jgi:hypothetical protein
MATDGAPDVDRFEWTSGNDSRVSHEAFIDGGGAGEVHKVTTSPPWTSLNYFVDASCEW